MRRSRRLALAMSVCALAAPAIAQAADRRRLRRRRAPRPPARLDGHGPRRRSRPTGRPASPPGLSPNTAAAPVKYPEQSVILTWGDVPKAVGYTVEVSDTPGFSRIVWKGKTTQAIAVPEILLPDGAYWWRVRAVDAAGTEGLWSDVARVAKTWPNQIAGTRLAATPNGPCGQLHRAQPVPVLERRPRRQDVRRRGLARATSSTTSSSSGTNAPQPFATPAAGGRAARRHLQLAGAGPGPQGQRGPLDRRLHLHQGVVAPGRRSRPPTGPPRHDLQLVVGADRRRPALRGPGHAARSSTGAAIAAAGRGLDRGDRRSRRPSTRRRPATWSTGRTGGGCARSSAASTAPGRPRAASTGSAPSPTYATPDLASTGDTVTGLSPDPVVAADHRRDAVPGQHRRGPPVQQPGRAAGRHQHLVDLAQAASRQPDRGRLLLARGLGQRDLDREPRPDGGRGRRPGRELHQADPGHPRAPPRTAASSRIRRCSRGARSPASPATTSSSAPTASFAGTRHAQGHASTAWARCPAR